LLRETHINAYVALFGEMIGGRHLQLQTGGSVSATVRHEIQAILYNEMVTNVLRIISQLDLSTHEQHPEDDGSRRHADGVGNGANSSDVVAGLVPANANDHTVLFILVEFVTRLFRSQSAELFVDWLPVLVERLTTLWAGENWSRATFTPTISLICLAAA
jgi:hypothetical protein